MTHFRRMRRFGWAVALCACLVIMSAAPANAAKVQVTHREYKHVKNGMTPKQVRQTIHFRPRAEHSGGGECLLYTAHGWKTPFGQMTVHFYFSKADGPMQLTGKDASPLGMPPGLPCTTT